MGCGTSIIKKINLKPEEGGKTFFDGQKGDPGRGNIIIF